MVLIICSECGNKLPKYAKGLCLNCYQRLKNREYSKTEEHKKRMRQYFLDHKELIYESRRQSYYKHHSNNLIRHKERQKGKLDISTFLIKHCEKCGALEDLEVHHLDYKEYGSRTQVLCRKCHCEMHRIKKSG